jgi:chymotrypsin
MALSKNTIVLLVLGLGLLGFLVFMIIMNNRSSPFDTAQNSFICPWWCQQPAIIPVPAPQPSPAPPVQPPPCGGRFSQKAVELTATPRIVGGAFAALGDWPWMVFTGGCGGALIHPQWILSAAHCSYQPGMMVSAGLIDLNNPGPQVQRSRIIRVVDHPQYNRLNFDNDICLLQIEVPMQINQYVQTACIGTLQSLGIPLTVTGWGNTFPQREPPSPSNLLKLATMKETIPCQAFPNIRPEGQICTVGEGSFSCFGDSGGPLHANLNGVVSVVGVVSFGNIPCDNTTIFTRVSYHLNFIRQYVPGV